MIGAVLNLSLVLAFFLLLESKAIGVSLALLFSELTITFLAAKIVFEKKIMFGKI